jgi:hypothetical protein
LRKALSRSVCSEYSVVQTADSRRCEEPAKSSRAIYQFING